MLPLHLRHHVWDHPSLSLSPYPSAAPSTPPSLSYDGCALIYLVIQGEGRMLIPWVSAS